VEQETTAFLALAVALCDPCESDPYTRWLASEAQGLFFGTAGDLEGWLTTQFEQQAYTQARGAGPYAFQYIAGCMYERAELSVWATAGVSRRIILQSMVDERPVTDPWVRNWLYYRGVDFPKVTPTESAPKRAATPLQRLPLAIARVERTAAVPTSLAIG
jgi:hypothetical protein